MPVLRSSCLLLALLASLGVSAAAELPEPAARGEAAESPRLKEDPSRVPNAPTTIAIDTTAQEDGPAAGAILAAKALAASRVAYGPDDDRVIVPLINAAHARQRSGDIAGALIDYRKAVALAEAASGPRDARLFDAWYGIGHAHLAAGQYAPAATALETALQLHRINNGLYSESQLPVLHALALAQRGMGRADDADELQIRRLDVAERVHGLGTVEVARVYVSAGRWFRNVGRSTDAVALHALAVQILDRQSKTDPRLIDPLIELALSGSERRRDPDEPMTPGLLQPGPALTRAEQLADAWNDGPARERAAAMIRIGDVHYALGRRDPALRVYAKATSLLAGVGEKPPFDEPAFISLRVPRPAALEGPDGHALAEFSVLANGKTRDARIVEVHPIGLPASVSASLVSAIKSARLRPRIVNGEPVASTGMRFRLPVRGGSAS